MKEASQQGLGKTATMQELRTVLHKNWMALASTVQIENVAAFGFHQDVAFSDLDVPMHVL